jgi:hypothetical protein
VTSVMNLLEERETAARARAEELRAETDRTLTELAQVEPVLERRVIARVEPAFSSGWTSAGSQVWVLSEQP